MSSSKGQVFVKVCGFVNALFGVGLSALSASHIIEYLTVEEATFGLADAVAVVVIGSSALLALSGLGLLALHRWGRWLGKRLVVPLAAIYGVVTVILLATSFFAGEGPSAAAVGTVIGLALGILWLFALRFLLDRKLVRRALDVEE